MIIIEITNIDELIKLEKGFVLAKIAPLVTDVEATVERLIIDEIEAAFAARGVKANISSVPGATWRLAN